MKILVVGSGAREHTIVWKLSHNTKVKEIFAAPGNAGTTILARNLDINPNDIPTLLKTAVEKKIDLTVVGPEVPLAEGIVDAFQAKELPIFGPTKAASQIETSKVFAKKLMHKYNIPCAPGNIFSSYRSIVNVVSRAFFFFNNSFNRNFSIFSPFIRCLSQGIVKK